MKQEWEAVIGLEIHIQLKTLSKIFSGASTKFGADPNTQACLIDLGMPGTLPVLNQEAIRMAIKFGFAINAKLNRYSVFSRKHYFYPDLPKGYQISQYEFPIVSEGKIKIELENSGESKVIGIIRAHLEEDAGKSLYNDISGMKGIDFNRAGIPLLEVVSAPDMNSPYEAVAYARKVHKIATYIGICSGNMEEGSFRCDANISVRPVGQKIFGTRTELKNINSFRFLERAIKFEIKRQINLVMNRNKVIQETRFYDSNRDKTRSMRLKEEANDYRYFPEPDLLPLRLNKKFIKEVLSEVPELPDIKYSRFKNEYDLSHYNATILTDSCDIANYFEETVAICNSVRLATNWITSDLKASLNKEGIDIIASPVTAEMLGNMIKRIKDKTISSKIAKKVFKEMWQGKGTVDEIIHSKGLKQITSTSAIKSIINKVLSNNTDQVKQYYEASSKKQPRILGFFVGQVIKISQGKANPEQVYFLLKTKLEKKLACLKL